MKEWIPPFLKQLELLTWRIRNLWLTTKKQFNIAKLFICYTHNPHFAKLRQYGFESSGCNGDLFMTKHHHSDVFNGSCHLC